MTHEQAQKILNRVRDRVHYPAAIINQALILTGDLDADEDERSEGVAEALSRKVGKKWVYGGPGMVESDD